MPIELETLGPTPRLEALLRRSGRTHYHSVIPAKAGTGGGGGGLFGMDGSRSRHNALFLIRSKNQRGMFQLIFFLAKLPRRRYIYGRFAVRA